MKRRANYRIKEEMPNYILIEDLGPWDQFLTVTNAAELVVKEMMPKLLAGGQQRRKLYYIDSEGAVDQLLHNGEYFTGFQAGGPFRPNTPAPELPRDDNAFYNNFRKTNPNWRGD